jgi:hypothetical protein
MLRYEKNNRKQTLFVFARDQEQFFSKPLIIAFGIAFSFHLLLMLTFHITPFILPGGNSVLPPIHVESSADGLGTVAFIDQPIQWIRGLPPPPPTLNRAQQPVYTMHHPVTWKEGQQVDRALFTQLEKSLYEKGFNPLERHEQLPFEMLISGILASVPLQAPSSAIALPKDLASSIDHDIRVVFAVDVDGRTGKVIWFDPREKSGRAAVDKHAEKLLWQMSFAIDPSRVVTSGEVEFHYRKAGR